MFQPPKHLLQARRTSTQDQEVGAARDQEVDHNSHPTPERRRTKTTTRRP